MQKVRYETDPFNRLVVAGGGVADDLPKFRRVIDGRFALDGDNNLSYRIKSPTTSADNMPNQFKLGGEWSLTRDHRLRLSLDKSARKTFGDELTLKGEILDVRKDSLLFAMTTAAKQGAQSTYVLTLSGSWKADERNRLSFRVRKESGRYDILAFTGAWDLDDNNQIVYEYESSKLLRKKVRAHTLIFKGCWHISENLRVSYLLGGDTDRALSFQTSAGVFKKDRILYEVGIRASKSARPVTRTVALFGTWNVSRDLGLVFETGYEDGKPHRMIFGADARLTDKDTVLFRLKGKPGFKGLGASLELSHRILGGDGEAFVRALKDERELAVYAGAGWRW
jgi:hypothetical protein